MSRLPDHPLDYRSPNALWGSVLVETLYRLGVRQVVISPGSRSTPLTMAFARHPGLEAIPVLDERSAGFFALGLAKPQCQPVVLLCTSGTAGANYFPAIIEAQESGVPLLVITADRPPEMRECHSGQTIDQQKLFGSHVNFYHECAVPAASLPMLRYLRQTVAHAVARTTGPARGPVHLNCPFRDPLTPGGEAVPEEITAKAFKTFFAGLAAGPRPAYERAAALGPYWKKMTRATRGVIVVGPVESAAGQDFSRQVGRLSRALGWPVLADALSPLRTHAPVSGHLVVHYDAILRSSTVAEALRPDYVICLGGWPTSKALRAWLQASDPEVLLVAAGTANQDALHLRSRFIHCEPGGWDHDCEGRRRRSEYTRLWLQAESLARQFLQRRLGALPFASEPRCVPLLARHLPVRTSVFVANSMPVRDAEYFWPATARAQRIYFNRGANGIDGTLSTALGVAHGRDPAVLLTGDLALLHDTNGFLSAAKFTGSLTIVLINNNGGGIFEHLPVADFQPPFEEFFATPQRVDFTTLCRAYGVKHVAVRSWDHFAGLIARLPARGIRVLEVRTNRKSDAACRRELFRAVARAVVPGAIDRRHRARE
jgi:2-succinyl-5-enolpyruvyl-6-hydroxy-3-cyclohexene-1-carboxylate synthase